MVRKLALAVSLALGTLSVPVHALGLGELSSKSALNQNFDGDITLLSVKPEELDVVRVRLADTDAFKRAGVDRPFYLSLLKFEPTLSKKGKSVIRVSSDFPIREPFMNFLIEVNWPNGRLLREYTVLLDPPTTTRRRPAKVSPAVRKPQAAPAPSAAAPAPAPVQQTSAPATAPSTGTDGYDYGPVVANDTAWSIAKKVRPGGVSMEQMMMALLNANPHAFVDGNINRLRKGRILRVPSLAEIRELTRQQARQAYRDQQDQWLAQRNQKLQAVADKASADGEAAQGAAGAADQNDQLRIATARPEGEGEAGAGDDDVTAPVSTDIKSRLIVARENAETSRQEAETLRTQVDDLQERLENMQKLLSLKDNQLAQLQDRVVTDETAAETAEPVQGLEIAEEAEPQPVAETAEQAEIVPPADAVAETAEQAAVVLAEEAEVGVAGEAVADDYRIQDIAPQVDPDLIVMGGGVETPETLEVAPQIDPDLIVEAAATEVLEIESAAEEIVDAADAEIVIEEAPADATVATETPADPAVAAVAPPEPAVVEQEAAADPVIAAVEEPTAAEPARGNPMMEMVEQNIVPIAVGGVSLLALFGWLVSRGRRKEEGAEPVLAAVAETAEAAPELPPVVDEPALDAEALNDLPESSFLDEFSPSDINSLQDETGEVDPVSEADVYIAYGRYQQAEEMLQQAMSRDPDRLALKHKLLEVHYATRNTGAFVALAQDMVDAGQDSADELAWSRARGMGTELSPDNALFALAEGEDANAGLDEDVGGDFQAVAAVAAAPPVDDDTLALDDLELSELTADFDDSLEHDLEAPSEVSISLDLDEPSGLIDATGAPELPELPESIQLDELEALDAELPKVELDDEPAGADDTISDSLDLDSMMAEAEAAVDADDSTLSLDSEFSADELQAQLDELSDLSVLDSETADAPAAVEPPAGLGLVEEDSGLAEEGLDQPLNLDTAFDFEEGEDAGAEVMEISEVAATPTAEPVGEDEVATKLDLARAYVEMGDEDGARAILEEVVGEGNQSQRGDAESLLSQLG